MGFSLNEIVSVLSERANKPLDIPFQEELKAMVIYWGARVMKNSLKNNPNNRRFMQTSFVVPLEKVSLIDCPVEYGCELQTACDIPAPLRTHGILYDYVGLPTMDSPFAYTKEELEQYLSHGKYTGKNIRYTYKDNRIKLRNASFKTIKYIGIRGIFPDPRKLADCLCNNKPCYSDDDVYPLPDDLVQEVIKAILTTELRMPNIEEAVEVDINKDATPSK